MSQEDKARFHVTLKHSMMEIEQYLSDCLGALKHGIWINGHGAHFASEVVVTQQVGSTVWTNCFACHVAPRADNRGGTTAFQQPNMSVCFMVRVKLIHCRATSLHTSQPSFDPDDQPPLFA